MKGLDVKVECLPLASLSCDTPEAERKVHALRRNPFAESGDVIGRISGVCDGREVGGEYVFPLLLRTPAGVLTVLAGSTLSVDPAYRRSGLGMDLPELRWQKSPSRTALGAALSQMALPVHELLGYDVFRMPRYVVAWKCRAVLEPILGRFVSRIFVPLLDIVVAVYALLLRSVAAVALFGIKVREVQPDDTDALKSVAELIASDGAAFSEVHDERWLKWQMTETFTKDGPARLFAAFDKAGLVGFCMVKRRFHEQASHRGFRDVWLGSAIEWHTRSGSEGILGWILVHTALKLKAEGVDAVEATSADQRLHRFFRRLGWIRVGDGNFVIKAGEGSSLFGEKGIHEIANWRLRPAMGDAGLS